MTGRLAGIGLVAAFASAAIAARQQPTFRASTDVVSIDVSVTSGRQPAAGLGASDFTLDDNGVRQTIDAVANASLPIDVTFVTGVSISAADSFAKVRQAMEQIRRRLSPEDRMSVIDYFTSVRTVVLMQTAAQIGPLDAPQSPIRLRSGGQVLWGPWAFEGASLNDAIFLALAWPVDSGRRHLIVLLTDGVDSWSTTDGDALVAFVNRSEAVMHFVMSAPKPDPAEANTRYGGSFVSRPDSPDDPGAIVMASPPTKAVLMQHLASWNLIAKATEQSGGLLHPMANLAETFGAIFDSFRSSYVLRYTLTGVNRAGWHDIAVKVTRPGFTIRARRGYGG